MPLYYIDKCKCINFSEYIGEKTLNSCMVLSVIIVSYRVKYFLELCLHSVEKAVKGLEAEIIVVDNQSDDDSLGYLRPRFPGVRFLANTENSGFGRANNLALKHAGGKFILFLNPD